MLELLRIRAEVFTAPQLKLIQILAEAACTDQNKEVKEAAAELLEKLQNVQPAQVKQVLKTPKTVAKSMVKSGAKAQLPPKQAKEPLSLF